MTVLFPRRTGDDVWMGGEALPGCLEEIARLRDEARGNAAQARASAATSHRRRYVAFFAALCFWRRDRSARHYAGKP